MNTGLTDEQVIEMTDRDPALGRFLLFLLRDLLQDNTNIGIILNDAVTSRTIATTEGQDLAGQTIAQFMGSP